MKYISILLFPFLLISCQETIKQEDAKPVKKIVEAKSLNGCYVMHIGKDTASLELTVSGMAANGILVYNRFDKDDNTGELHAQLQGDYIKGWYRFSSEGMISVKETYFKLSGSKLLEGYGEMELRNDTAVFKFPTAVVYEDKHPYIKVDCKTDI